MLWAPATRRTGHGTAALALLLGFYGRGRGDGVAGEADAVPDFVNTFAPVVWLHSDDPYMPSDILSHIRHSTPDVNGAPIRDLPELDLDNLEVLNEFSGQVSLKSNDDPDTFHEWLHGTEPDSSGKVHNATPCAVVLVDKSPTELDAFYFYFYSFNEGPNITQVLEPINQMVSGEKAESGIHFGNHVGDWEHNMIRFKDGAPVGVYYSQHGGGKAYDWDDPSLSMKNQRPVVYSARGSHANYAEPGGQIHDSVMVDYCDAGKLWDPIMSAYYYRFDPTSSTFTRLPLLDDATDSATPLSNQTSFLYFDGRWGDAQYPDSDPRQETIPRFGIKRYVTGPTGPKHKQLVRKGLLPDRRHKISWTEWAVKVYMAWYPCCLRGWRIWVFYGVIAVALSGVVLAIVWGVRRCRRRGAYTKVHTGDIPLDDWGYQDDALLSSDDESEERRGARSV